MPTHCEEDWYPDRSHKPVLVDSISALATNKYCGYNKCLAALEFHHPNSDKDFGLSQKGITRSWEKVKLELDKCELVCCNCHKEIHWGD